MAGHDSLPEPSAGGAAGAAASVGVHTNGDADAGPSRWRSSSRSRDQQQPAESAPPASQPTAAPPTSASAASGTTAAASAPPAASTSGAASGAAVADTATGASTPQATSDARPTHSPSATTTSRQSSPHRGQTPHLDLATYPTPTLLRLLASLLQQIASANDQLRAEHDDEHGNGGAAPPEAAQQQVLEQPDEASVTGSTSTVSRTSSITTHPSPTTALFHNDPPPLDLAAGDRLFTASKASLSHPSSILSFHARHVPSISIEAYLLRILKYCPTTNEVFLGLLVYFDRMSKLGTPQGVGGTSAAVGPRGFAIDSYNVHRLIIAGVTVASKFFSDVFYTNSRYAKVGGLPPHELNQLELQFLLLNNFTLMIPPEEMQKYGDRLLAYWQTREQEASGASVASTPKEGEAGQRRRSASEHGARDRQGRETDGMAKTPTQASQSTPMDVDEPQPRPDESQTQPQAPSATAPATPTNNRSSDLARSSSLPRRPVFVDKRPSSSSSPMAPRGRERDRPGVSFAPTGRPKVATTVPSGLGGWAARADDSAVGVGP